MPRYCAVKVCKNRGGTLSKQEHKRISFYPFPLQDISRLQKWVGNMRRERWAPSRHQYLCSEHFTEDCFDIRWGIRYLKGAAVPTIFPYIQEESEIKCKHSLHTPNKTRRDATDAGLSSPKSQLNKRPLILTRTASVTSPTTTTSTPLVTNSNICKTDFIQACLDYTSTCPSTALLNENLTANTQDAERERTGDSSTTPAVSSAPSSGEDRQPQGEVDSTATMWYCDSPGHTEEITTVATDTKPPESGLRRAFGFVPLETIICGISEDARHPEEYGGQAFVDDDHSYCRGADTDRQQLWRKILTLHAKVLELDHREENTMASIHALESKIARLKRDAVAFKEKQKLLEDCICSILL